MLKKIQNSICVVIRVDVINVLVFDAKSGTSEY